MDRARPFPRPGPVTGALERPSQHSPENRKADDRRKPQDERKSARVSLRSAHLAERQFQFAAQHAERQHTLASLLAATDQSRSIALAVVDARFAERRRLIALIADPNARAAAERQLALELSAEHSQLAQQHRHAMRALRNALLQPLSQRHRSERRSLTIRQRHQRGVLGVILRQLRPLPLEPHHVPGVRRLRIDPSFLYAGRRAT